MPVPAAPGSTTGSSSKSGTIGDGKGSGVSPNGGRPGGTQPAKEEQSKVQPAQSLKFTGSGSASSTQRYPSDLSIGSDSDYVRFDFYQYSPPFKDRKTGGAGSSTDYYNASASNYTADGELTNIILYMPEDVSTGYKANWQGKNFSNIGADMLGQAGSTNFTKLAENVINGVADAIENVGAITNASVINAALGKITGESVSMDELFSSTRGVIMNPNSELLFTGFDMRNFTLNYKLVPRNASEANSIESIIRTFKKAMLPSANSGEGPSFTFDIAGFGGAYNANYIKVPSVCKVSFMRGGSLNPNVPQYKHCAITQVDVGYTPDGTYATTHDGKMVAYTLSLAFQETKLIYREEIASSGASY